MTDVKKILITDKNYPELLKKIPSPPKALYIKGELKSEENCFAIVGTRKCSFYGKQIAMEMAGNLADSGLTIVSGLAPGIDSFSHKAVVEKGKRTIAILGTSLDENSFYPKENIALAKKIVELGGCLVSEYPEGTRGTKFTFPDRNRIISGLSLGTLVVEAKIKSGSLITANFTLRQKRKLFAIPGPIYSENSKGCNLLIKKGAKLTDSYKDILQELGFNAISLNNKTGKIKTEQDIIIKILSEGPLHIDKIIEKSKLNSAKTASLLAEMEIEGKIRNLGQNIFALILN